MVTSEVRTSVLGRKALGSKRLVVHYVADDFRHSLLKCLSYLDAARTPDWKKGLSHQEMTVLLGRRSWEDALTMTSLET
jgi:hypothetical protein